MPRSRRLAVCEPLEARRLLAVITWNGGGDAMRFSDPDNWDLTRVPMDGDEVLIGSNAGQPVVVDIEGLDLAKITATGHLRVGVSMTLAGASSIGTLEALAGTMTLAAGLGVDFLDWRGMTFSGAGDVNVVNGLFGTTGPKWLSGVTMNIIGDVQHVAGFVTLSPQGVVPTVLRVLGKLQLRGGSVSAGAGATGLPEVKLLNSGTLVGDGASRITLYFDSGGAIDVKSGELRLTNFSTIASTVTIAAGATLLSTGDTTFTGGSASGEGALVVQNATTRFNANVAPDGLRVEGGVVHIADALTVERLFEWTTGTITGGALRTLGQALASTNAPKTLAGAQLVNRGSFEQLDAQIIAGNILGPGTLENLGGATWLLRGRAEIFEGHAQSSFLNLGQLVVEGTTQASFISVRLSSNAQSVHQLRSGRLEVRGGGNLAGGFAFLPGAVLSIGGRTLEVADANFALAGFGDGRVELVGGALDVRGNTAIPHFVLLAGNVAGSADLTISGTFQWSGGGMTESGATILGPGAQASFDTNIGRDLWNGRRLQIAGTLNLASGVLRLGALAGLPTRIEVLPGGTLNVAGGASIQAITSPMLQKLDIQGVLNKTGPGVAGIAAPVDNRGAVQVQEGTLNLLHPGTHTGQFNIAPGAELRQSGASTFGAASSVTGEGLVRFGGADHEFRGDFSGPSVAVESTVRWAAGNAWVEALAISNSVRLDLIDGAALRAGSLALAPGSHATLDVSGGSLILAPGGQESAAFDALYALVVSGRGAGAWNGLTGVTSLAASAAPADLTVGIASADQLFGPGGSGTVGGMPLGAGEALVRLTRAGDADLDGRVDVADLGRLASNWLQSPRRFADGDLNYSGAVDVADLGVLASNWQAAELSAATARPGAIARALFGSSRILLGGDERAWGKAARHRHVPRPVDA